MFYCSKCGAKLSDDADFCSKCGRRVDRSVQVAVPVKRKSKWWLVVLIILIIIGMLWYFGPRMPNSSYFDVNNSQSSGRSTSDNDSLGTRGESSDSVDSADSNTGTSSGSSSSSSNSSSSGSSPSSSESSSSSSDDSTTSGTNSSDNSDSGSSSTQQDSQGEDEYTDPDWWEYQYMDERPIGIDVGRNQYFILPEHVKCRLKLTGSSGEILFYDEYTKEVLFRESFTFSRADGFAYRRWREDYVYGTETYAMYDNFYIEGETLVVREVMYDHNSGQYEFTTIARVFYPVYAIGMEWDYLDPEAVN